MAWNKFQYRLLPMINLINSNYEFFSTPIDLTISTRFLLTKKHGWEFRERKKTHTQYLIDPLIRIMLWKKCTFTHLSVVYGHVLLLHFFFTCVNYKLRENLNIYSTSRSRKVQWHSIVEIVNNYKRAANFISMKK